MTAGSLSMTDSGSALRQAAAEVRALLLERAASVLDAPPVALEVFDGTIVEPSGARRVSYWSSPAAGRSRARPPGRRDRSRRARTGSSARRRATAPTCAGSSAARRGSSPICAARGWCTAASCAPEPRATLTALDDAPARALAGSSPSCATAAS